MFAFPGHVLGNSDGGFGIREQHPIPILFESSVGPFHGVVLAVIRCIVGKLYCHLMPVCEFHRPFDKLRAPAVVFRTVVLIDEQCHAMVLLFPFGPVLLYAIPHIIAGYFRLREGDEKVIVLGQQNAEWGKRAIVSEVMIGCLHLDSAATASGKTTELHGSFGIHGQLQDALSPGGFIPGLCEVRGKWRQFPGPSSTVCSFSPCATDNPVC
jgi:hypothetical protein